MKLAKSLLLGSVAGLAAAAGAQAADLPMKKAAPVEYVRVCSVHGAGFFYIPGSDTCIKIGGRVRAEYRYLEPTSSFSRGERPNNGNGSIALGGDDWFNPGRASDATGFRARGRINVDARTATEWGTLRTFIQVDVTADTGNYRGIGRNGVGPAGDDTSIALDKAYIQWAGITAGRISSFFDFYATALNFGSGYMASLGSDNGSVNVLAYTATFGNGFSATIALEDRSAVVRSVFGSRDDGRTADVLGGQRMPSIVGNIRVDQGWGSAQLSGVVQQLNTSVLNTDGGRIDTEYGYAIQAGVRFNLPMLAAGDALWLQAAYADGAVGRLGLGATTAFAGLTGTAVDGAIVDGNIKRTKGWGVTAALLHYWTPSVRQAVFGNYTAVDYSGRVSTAYGALDDFKIWTVGTNVIWSPVSAFDIGVEVLYQKLDPKGRVVLPTGVSKSSVDIWEARIRFQRDF